MDETIHYSCPNCDYPIGRPKHDGDEFVCPECRSKYTALIDESTGRVAMVDQDTRRAAPPLYLPSGSVRALVSLTLAFLVPRHPRPGNETMLSARVLSQPGE